VVLLEFSIAPMDKGESVSQYVARAIDVVQQSGVDYRMHAMGTVLEGPWDEVFGVVRQCFDALREDCERISVTIKVDYRKGYTGRLESKVQSVERRLGQPVKK
jgi:uncharacterized protein (TIGR00106 family)